MTTIAAIYKCPACGSEYDSQEKAEGCRDGAHWPEDTQLATRGWGSFREVFMVRVEQHGEAKCRQFVSIRKHPAWGKESMGRCLISDKQAHEEHGGFCSYKPLTPEKAQDALKGIEGEARSLRRKAEKLDKQAKVMRDFIDGTYKRPVRV